jgi:hypothetical protein
VSARTRLSRFGAAALCGLAFAGAVQAQEVTITLVPTSTLTGAQGERITFRATVRNGASSARYLNQLSVTVQGTDQLAGDPSPFYSSFAGQLAAGAQLADKPFFSIEIEKTAPTNTYTGTVAILGGATEADADSLAQVDFTVKVDPASAGAPDTTITQGPPDLGKACETAAQFCWTGTDNLTDTAQLQFAYKLDTGDWSSYTGDTCHTFDGLSEGLHALQVRAKDSDGNVDATPAVRQFYVDLTAPTLMNIAEDVRDYRAAIMWNTSEPATGEVEYGETDQYGLSTGIDSTMTGAHRITLPNLRALTDYHYRVKSGDGCRDTVSPDRTFRTTDILRPDLATIDLKCPTDAGALQRITVTWRVQNIGRGDAAAPWTDSIYLSESSTLDGSAVPLGSLTVSQPLLELEMYQQTMSLKVPLKPVGKYYVLLKADSGSALTEPSTTNNITAVPIELLQSNNLVAGPDSHVLSLNPTEAVQGRFDIGNLSSVRQTGLSAVVQGAPANIAVQVSLPQFLDPLQSAPASFSVVASDESVTKAAATVTIRSAEGEQTAIRLDLTVIPRLPVLVSSPGSLETGMVRGKQATIECEITNSGSIAATGLVVDIPAAPWLSLTTPLQPADIPPGGKAKIGLALLPAAGLPLGPYTGQIVVHGPGTNLPIGFRFICTSTARGDVRVVAEDEYTYFADAKPPVAGAKVKLVDVSTSSVMASGITDSAGTFTAQNVPEGAYNLEVTEEKHTTHRSTLLVEPGQENKAKAFLGRNLVTYNWTVVPVETEDRYTVTLETVFETHVPAPVVTIDPAYLDLRKIAFDAAGKAVVNYTITNHGFIAADDTELNFGENSSYTATPAVRLIGRLPALATLVVPVTFVRIASRRGSLSDCTLPAWVKMCYDCGDKKCRDVPCTIVTGTCAGGGSSIPPSAGGTGGSSTASLGGPPNVMMSSCCDPDFDVKYLSTDPCSAGFKALPSPLYACAGTIITFIGLPHEDGGTWLWSGGEPQGATNGMVYMARFPSDGRVVRYPVQVMHTCRDGTKTATQVFQVEVDRPYIAASLTVAIHPDLLTRLGIDARPALARAHVEGEPLLLNDDDGPGDGGINDDRCLEADITLVEKPWDVAYSGAEYLIAGGDTAGGLRKIELQWADFADVKVIYQVYNLSTEVGAETDMSTRRILMPTIGDALTPVALMHELGHRSGISGHRDQRELGCPTVDRNLMGSRQWKNDPKSELNTSERSQYLNLPNIISGFWNNYKYSPTMTGGASNKPIGATDQPGRPSRPARLAPGLAGHRSARIANRAHRAGGTQ